VTPIRGSPIENGFAPLHDFALTLLTQLQPLVHRGITSIVTRPPNHLALSRALNVSSNAAGSNAGGSRPAPVLSHRSAEPVTPLVRSN
jgi:hypothetical protein